MDRHPAVFVVEHSDEFEARAERVEVLAQCRHAHVVGVLELGDRTLGDVEPAGEFGLADRLTMTKLVQSDLLEGLSAEARESFRRAGLSSSATQGRARPASKKLALSGTR